MSSELHHYTPQTKVVTFFSVFFLFSNSKSMVTSGAKIHDVGVDENTSITYTTLPGGIPGVSSEHHHDTPQTKVVTFFSFFFLFSNQTSMFTSGACIWISNSKCKALPPLHYPPLAEYQVRAESTTTTPPTKSYTFFDFFFFVSESNVNC